MEREGGGEWKREREKGREGGRGGETEVCLETAKIVMWL